MSSEAAPAVVEETSRNDNDVFTPTRVSNEPPLDIEHMPVTNDPRCWSNKRKNTILFLVSGASLIAGLAGNIQNPAIEDMERDLPATSPEISWTISVFILVQGLFPLVWSAISEIKGRKAVYVASLVIFTLASVGAALSQNVDLLIGLRALQAAGSSSFMSIAAATLADIFDPAERGTKMGIFYTAPISGPAIAPILGGVLTTGFNWRAPFWLLAIISGLGMLAFTFFFRDTFRRQRSLTYQKILKARMRAMNTKALAQAAQRVREKDLERQETAKSSEDALKEIKLSFADINPVKPMWYVLKMRHNQVILFASGILFGFTFLIVYTASRTLGSSYGYNPLRIGFVLLSFGAGCMVGSIIGGRWSDSQLAKLKAVHGGKGYPEMRLRSTLPGMLLAPFACCSYGWVSDQHVHISAMCVMLFLSGFAVTWIYSSTLAYIVDSNLGRSSTATACNSMYRGIAAFAAIEVAVPLQDTLGDGWLYTLWAGLLIISSAMILLVLWRGRRWREKSNTREAGGKVAVNGKSDNEKK